MMFLNPILAVAGVACVAIPILIHLLMRRRRRPVMWAAMRFVLEALRQQRRRLRLEQILLLAARCLVIVLIAVALGRPIIGQAAGLGGRTAVTLYLLVDDSLTAAARDESTAGTALDRHKAAAAELLKQLDATGGDRAGLISLAGPARAVVIPASSNISEVGDLVRSLAPSDSAADFAGAMATLQSVLERTNADSGRTVVVILSDFLLGSADTERRLAELPRATGRALLATPPAERGVPNITVEAVDPLRAVLIAGAGEEAGGTAPVRISLRRSGPGISSPAISTVRLRLEPPDSPMSATAGQTVIRWEPGQAEAIATIDVAVPPRATGSLVLTASVEDDALARDNARRRVIEIRPSLRIGLIAPRRLGAGVRQGVQQFEPADWFRVALDPTLGDRPSGSRAAREIEVIEIDPASVDAPRLAGLDGVVVARPDGLSDAAWRQLRTLADGGGLVVVSPPPGVTVHLWADAMVRELGLPWTVGREARSFAEPALIAPGTDRGRRTGPGRDLLTMIAAELPELSKPVRVFRALRVEPLAEAADTHRLLSLADGTPLLLSARPALPDGVAESAAPGRGLVVFLAVAPSFDWTDLQAKPLMVPLVQEIVRQGVAGARGAWGSIAGDRPQVPSRAVELRPLEGGRPIAAAAGLAQEAVRRAGLFTALDERGGVRALVAVNPDAAAGRTDPQSPGAVLTWLGGTGLSVEWLRPAPGAVGEASGHGAALRAALDRGNDATPWVLALLIAALSLATVELCLARWFSHAYVTPAGGRGEA